MTPNAHRPSRPASCALRGRPLAPLVSFFSLAWLAAAVPVVPVARATPLAVLLALATSLAAGCATASGLLGGESPERAATQETNAQAIAVLEKKLSATTDRMDGLDHQHLASRRDATQFQHELQDLRNQLRQVRKTVEIDARRARSGLSIDLDPGAAKRVEEAEDRLSAAKPVDIAGRLGDSEPGLAETPLGDDASPARLTDEAEEKMRLARYGEAVVVLTDVQGRFPRFDDGGRSLLLLADGWMKLGEPQNALPALRQVYTRFPTSFRIPDAKLLEARAQEKLGARQKALALYRELLATQAEGRQGQEARAALTRLRDEP